LISVNKFANLLVNEFGIKKGDRVALYMPMIPETVFAMLACARIGAVHVAVFGGFSAEVLSERIIDTNARAIITVDGSFRRGKPYMLKPIVDTALEKCPPNVCARVLVIEHNHQKTTFIPERDHLYHTLVQHQKRTFTSEPMDSEDTSFILHTSGSTGRPKGIRHTIAGYILWAQYTTEMVFDLKKDDVFWCTADVGWITGHTYGVYGPLAAGATVLIYEGVPNYPDAGRWWKNIEKHRVTQFYTAPTAIRSLHMAGPNEPKRYDLSSLKILGTVGEPIDPEAWLWYYYFVGGGRCPIIDTWWQTETGGHIIAPLPGATPTKPGSATLPLPGIHAEILDAAGRRLGQGERGFLCITKPWPSMFRSIWHDDDRYAKAYFNIIKKKGSKEPVYFSGDGAFYDQDGYIVVTGRTDDVMNVSGHRISSAEIESAATRHEKVAEAAAVGCPDNITGENIVVYVVCQADYTSADTTQLLNELNEIMAKEIGPIIKIKTLIAVPGLPKTRSGKILRRILRSIARSEQLPVELSTIEDAAVVEIIQELHHNHLDKRES
jgi:acetyl-CoA synthetase